MHGVSYKSLLRTVLCLRPLLNKTAILHEIQVVKFSISAGFKYIRK